MYVFTHTHTHIHIYTQLCLNNVYTVCTYINSINSIVTNIVNSKTLIVYINLYIIKHFKNMNHAIKKSPNIYTHIV